jgi:hypothetical protein
MQRALLSAASLASFGLLASSASAQNDITWASFTQDNSRIPTSGVVSSDSQEKDYAWGDLDKDGYTDMVIVRKQPFTTSGHFPNVLLMNQAGTLVDQTAAYASASDVPGDQGFLTPTNDRDVQIADVNGDTWLDVITVTTFSIGTPKHISHPRVYINLGDDGVGSWQGLEYQEARFPDFGAAPFFCGVGVGDVTGNGSPDLYFAHYHQNAPVDLEDRLVINDGNGFFTDESVARMTTDMRESSFGVSANIADVNGDGVMDVIKDTALGSTGASGPSTHISYNDPGNEGFFNIKDTVYSGAPYHTNVGDINMDGMLDLVMSDDGTDRYLLNNGNDALGRVIWDLNSLNDSGGFGSNNLITDINNDGWGDILICDVDVDISGCGRDLLIYHNRGGVVGGDVTMTIEGGGGFDGVTGITSAQQVGVHDIAVFDIDNDGDKDFVIGRCTGTQCYLNNLDPAPPTGITIQCDPASNHVMGNYAKLNTSSLGAGTPSGLHLAATDGPAGQFGFFLVSSDGSQNLPVFNGILCLGAPSGRYESNIASNQGLPQLNSIGQFDAMGVLQNLVGSSAAGDGFDVPSELPFTPSGQLIVPGSTWYFQLWFRDVAGGSPSANFSNTLEVAFP